MLRADQSVRALGVSPSGLALCVGWLERMGIDLAGADCFRSGGAGRGRANGIKAQRAWTPGDSHHGRRGAGANDGGVSSPP